MTQDSLPDKISQEDALLVFRLSFDVVVEIFSGEAWRTDYHAANLRVGLMAIACKVRYERRDDMIIEFALRLSILLRGHGAS